MKVLVYKGIVFDEYTQNEDGTYWAEICQKCVEKHWDLVSDVIDDGVTARGCCSIKGCFNDGDAEEKMHYYIDFKPEFVSFKEVDENDDYDEQYK